MKFSITDTSITFLLSAVRGLLILFTLFAGYAHAQDTGGTVPLQAGNDGIAIRNWVDRTALYPGDTVNYHIEIRTDSTTDILTDDLSVDELDMDGLEPVMSDLQQRTSEDGSYYHAHYSLTSFESGRPQLGIGPMVIRYYHKRPGQRLEDVATAGEVTAPAISLSLSSTLPGKQDGLALRDSAGPGIADYNTHTGTYGLVLILLAAVPLGLLVRNRWSSATLVEEHPLEEMLEHTVSEVQELKALDAQDEEQRRNGFSQVETIIKEYLESTAGIAARALTAGEITRQLADSGFVIEDLYTVLERTEAARYGRTDDLPSPEAFDHSIQYVQGLLSSR